MPKVDITLFVDVQEKLERNIVEQRGIEGPLVDAKILALNVEIAELAQEWGIFKYWKRVPKTKSRTAMLEEYVDVFHFILSLIVERIDHYPSLRTLVVEYPEDGRQHHKESIMKLFNEMFENAAYLVDNYPFNYKTIIALYFRLGYELGFSFDEVAEAYFQKNKVNHDRLKNGY